jgi:hypothetical protein
MTTREATVRTAQVEIKALTISGKQVTLAVFRQLQKEDLITENLEFAGIPWGTVNYHPDCAQVHEPHVHVVWQKGDELRRAVVLEAWPSGYSLMRRLEALVTHLCHFKALRGECPERWTYNPNVYSARVTHLVDGVEIHASVPRCVIEVWNALRSPHASDTSWDPENRWEHKHMKSQVEQSIKTANRMPPDETGTELEINALALDYDEGSEAWQSRYNDLCQLDQLFIAV